MGPPAVSAFRSFSLGGFYCFSPSGAFPVGRFFCRRWLSSSLSVCVDASLSLFSALLSVRGCSTSVPPAPLGLPLILPRLAVGFTLPLVSFPALPFPLLPLLVDFSPFPLSFCLALFRSLSPSWPSYLSVYCVSTALSFPSPFGSSSCPFIGLFAPFLLLSPFSACVSAPGCSSATSLCFGFRALPVLRPLAAHPPLLIAAAFPFPCLLRRSVMPSLRNLPLLVISRCRSGPGLRVGSVRPRPFCPLALSLLSPRIARRVCVARPSPRPWPSSVCASCAFPSGFRLRPWGTPGVFLGRLASCGFSSFPRTLELCGIFALFTTWLPLAGVSGCLFLLLFPPAPFGRAFLFLGSGASPWGLGRSPALRCFHSLRAPLFVLRVPLCWRVSFLACFLLGFYAAALWSVTCCWLGSPLCTFGPPPGPVRLFSGAGLFPVRLLPLCLAPWGPRGLVVWSACSLLSPALGVVRRFSHYLSSAFPLRPLALARLMFFSCLLLGLRAFAFLPGTVRLSPCALFAFSPSPLGVSSCLFLAWRAMRFSRFTASFPLGLLPCLALLAGGFRLSSFFWLSAAVAAMCSALVAPPCSALALSRSCLFALRPPACTLCLWPPRPCFSVGAALPRVVASGWADYLRLPDSASSSTHLCCCVLFMVGRIDLDAPPDLISFLARR